MDPMMTCRELTEFLIDYHSGELPPEERARFEAHLTECADCVQYLRSYEETIRLARGALGDDDAPVPASVPEDLVRAILASRSSDRR